MKDIIDILPTNSLVNIYLMASYLYYERHLTPMPDTDYDILCKKLLDSFNDVDHQHGGLIDKDALRAGTAYHIRENEYPILVKQAAFAWYDKGCPLPRVRRRRRRRNI